MANLEIIYLIGSLIAFCQAMYSSYKENVTYGRKGKIYVSDIAFSLFVSLISWLTVLIFIVLYFHNDDNDRIIIH